MTADNKYRVCRQPRPSPFWCLGACLYLWVGAAQAGEWTIEPRVTVEEQYTDNARSVANGEESDFITTITAGVSVDGNGRRAQLSLDYDISRDTYFDTGDLDGFRQDLIGVGNVEFWEDHLFVDIRAALNQQDLSRGGGDSAGDRTVGSNQSLIANYSISPRLIHGNNGWADSELRYSFSETRFLDSDVGAAAAQPDNSRTHQIQTSLRSGRRFTRLTWSLTGQTSFTYRGDGQNSKNRTTDLRSEYAVTRQISLISQVGYEDRNDVGLNDDDNSGLTWRGGVRLRPGPRTDARIEYGRRFGGFIWSGDLTHRITARTTIRASYEEDIQTQQQALNAALLGLQPLPGGGFINPVTGLPVNPNDPGFSFTSRTTRNRTANLSVVKTLGRTELTVATFYNTRSFDDGITKQEQNWGINANATRRLSRQMTGSVLADYSRDSGSSTGGAGDWTLRGNASLGYDLDESLLATMNYSFLRRESDTISDDLIENLISVRLRKVF